MATTVTITGSGTPFLAAGRAGAGVLVRHDSATIQIDAGRATVLRIAEAGVDLTELSAVLLTHHHSDHMLGMTDLVLTRWTIHGRQGCAPLPIYCPIGPAIDYLEHLFEYLEPDVQSRIGVSGYPIRPEPDVTGFEPSADDPVNVTTIGEIDVDAIAVDHGDLAPAVAYRLTTPDGVVVISGDTTICPQVETLAANADILVHEAFSSDLLHAAGQPASRIENLAHHHADARDVGELASRLDVPELVITHMVPSPQTPQTVAAFENAIRDGGYGGKLTISDDLYTTTLVSKEDT